MQFVEDHRVDASQHLAPLRIRQQQGDLLRRRQQDVGRDLFLPLPLVRGRVAGAGLDADVEADPGDGSLQVAGNVHRQRLQRRDIERMDALPRAGRAGLAARALRQGDEAGQEAGQRLAGAGRGDQEHRVPRARGLQQLELMRARAPAAAFEPAGETFRQQGRRGGIHRVQR